MPETRFCKRCGTPFVVPPSSTKLACSFICGIRARENNHLLIHTSEYSAWRDMKARCQRVTHKDYCKYGARGITVCERWQDFKNFYADMGDKPAPSYSIERVDNNGNYESSNCKWGTKLEQSRNRRGTYTAAEDQILRDAITRGCNFAQIAPLLGRRPGAVSSRAYRLGLKSGQPPIPKNSTDLHQDKTHD